MCRGKLQLSKGRRKSIVNLKIKNEWRLFLFYSEPHSSVGANVESTPKVSTPRTPNAFALFVKENYATIKSSRTDLPHAAVMKLLSAKFAEHKKQML